MVVVVVDIDLVPGDVDITRCVFDYRGAATLDEQLRGERFILAKLAVPGARIVFTDDEMAVSHRERRQL